MRDIFQFAEVVWFHHSRGKTYGEICDILWPRLLKAGNLDYHTEMKITRIKSLKTWEERHEAILLWLKGKVDVVLLNVYRLNLIDDFLNNPEKYTQHYCMQLYRDQRNKWAGY